ncbi:VOC family protein [Agromyces sp. CFH 90414]|uniref:VOC family protein n=1 Tax=Agromyces agglutinans TaxID=2662258 RepID=A0A6I2F8F2_9MICO|nr:VOC family protein [Agromyces agglutinans]MRG60067.1 VOC family protein [Agromyces agglutinans]
MSVLLNPYLSFTDNAREALEFYHSVFGGRLDISTFGESGQGDDPADANKVMHGQLTTENGFTLMASDTPPGMDHEDPAGISISLSGDEESTLRGYWEALSEGGTPVLPLEVAPWGDAFGMLVDRFGVSWMVNITGAQPA